MLHHLQHQVNDLPVIPRHHLDHPGAVKVMLGNAASDALRGVGEYHLCVITEPDNTAPPGAAGRLVLVCLPLTKERAHEASLVALGRMAARRVKPAKNSPTGN